MRPARPVRPVRPVRHGWEKIHNFRLGWILCRSAVCKRCLWFHVDPITWKETSMTLILGTGETQYFKNLRPSPVSPVSPVLSSFYTIKPYFFRLPLLGPVGPHDLLVCFPRLEPLCVSPRSVHWVTHMWTGTPTRNGAHFECFFASFCGIKVKLPSQSYDGVKLTCSLFRQWHFLSNSRIPWPLLT